MMKILKISFIINLSCVMLYSCSIHNNIAGNYGSGDKLSSTNFKLRGNGIFEYEFSAEGFGHHEWSCGKWTKFDNNKIRMVSINHDNIPINVFEESQNSEKIIIILPQVDAQWAANIFLLINGKSFEIPKNSHVLFLMTEDFPEIKTISVKAKVVEDNFLKDCVSYSEISTSIYNVKDNKCNIFHVTFPFPNFSTDLFSYFYFTELNDTITIKKNKLIWNGYKYHLKR